MYLPVMMATLSFNRGMSASEISNEDISKISQQMTADNWNTALVLGDPEERKKLNQMAFLHLFQASIQDLSRYYLLWTMYSHLNVISSNRSSVLKKPNKHRYGFLNGEDAVYYSGVGNSGEAEKKCMVRASTTTSI